MEYTTIKNLQHHHYNSEAYNNYDLYYDEIFKHYNTYDNKDYKQ